MACVYIQEMTDLKSVIDYTVAFAFDSLFLIAPYPEEKSRLLAPISPFQPMVQKKKSFTFNYTNYTFVAHDNHSSFRFGYSTY